MKTNQEILNDFMEGFRTGVIRSQEQKGLKASGKSAASLQVHFVNRNIVQLIDGSGSFEFQEVGRGPGRAAPFKDLFAWVGLKKYGINFSNEKQQAAITFAIQKKQRAKGTYTHQHGATGVLTDVLNIEGLDKVTQALRDKYGELVADAIINKLLNKQTGTDLDKILDIE